MNLTTKSIENTKEEKSIVKNSSNKIQLNTEKLITSYDEVGSKSSRTKKTNSENRRNIKTKLQKNMNSKYDTEEYSENSYNENPINDDISSYKKKNTILIKKKKDENKLNSTSNVSNPTVNSSKKSNKLNTSENRKKVTKEEDLRIYKGNVDYKNVSLKKLKEVSDDLLKKYKHDGFKCVLNLGNVFEFVKGHYKYRAEIFRLPKNKMLFTSIKLV